MPKRIWLSQSHRIRHQIVFHRQKGDFRARNNKHFIDIISTNILIKVILPVDLLSKIGA